MAIRGACMPMRVLQGKGEKPRCMRTSRTSSSGRHALWVILPVRGEAAGKSRLAAVLDPIERMRLNRKLLRRTLG
ncbi:MAG: hypothetical protein ACREUX_02730, partial [Burkholderiales bacterium]